MLVAQKKPAVMCGNWNVRQATSQQMFEMTTFGMDTASSLSNTDQSHHTPRSAVIQPMSQQAAVATRPYLVLDTRAPPVACPRRGNMVRLCR